MPTSFSLNKDLQSSWFMRETIQQTLMTKQGGPTEWPPDAQEVWDRLNASRNALDKAIVYARGFIGRKNEKEGATPTTEEEYW